LCKQKAQAKMDDLPDECIIHILAFVEQERDLQSVCCVSKLLNQLGDDDLVWKTRVISRFPGLATLRSVCFCFISIVE
jgi:hypothetical protein